MLERLHLERKFREHFGIANKFFESDLVFGGSLELLHARHALGRDCGIFFPVAQSLRAIVFLPSGVEIFRMGSALSQLP